jgi:hypothetical protein
MPSERGRSRHRGVRESGVTAATAAAADRHRDIAHENKQEERYSAQRTDQGQVERVQDREQSDAQYDRRDHRGDERLPHRASRPASDDTGYNGTHDREPDQEQQDDAHVERCLDDRTPLHNSSRTIGRIHTYLKPPFPKRTGSAVFTSSVPEVRAGAHLPAAEASRAGI